MPTGLDARDKIIDMEDTNYIKSLKDHYSYSPDSGIVVWKKRTSNRTKVGNVVGGKPNALGYLVSSLGGKQNLVHRVIMEMEVGRKLEFNEVIDHINGDKTDNRLCNLRLTDRAGNAKGSRKKTMGKTSKYKGVFFSNKDASKPRPWIAKVSEGTQQWTKHAKTELDAAFYYNCELLRRGWPTEGLNVLERGVA